MNNREQLIQELSQAPDDLVQAVLEFLHRVKATRAKYPLHRPTLDSFVGALQNSPSFSDDPVMIQQQMRDEWD
jgi:hypothetical protein